jgi:predicted AlkP superfamily phosphohydrolase/phosphomutase
MLAILQLDAISRPIVERMLGEGRLPTLAGLSARGEWRTLRTPATYYTGATHPTLYSGVELGEHSQYYLFQWSPEEQRIRYRRSFDAPEMVWERLARAGRRTLAIDPYEGVPPRGPAGVVLSGVQFFNFLGLERWASSRDAGRTIRRFTGRSPYADEVFGEPWLPGLLSLRRRLAQAPSRLGDAAVGLLGEQAFDLVWLTFLTTHIGGHQFWDLSQLDEDALDESERALLLSTLPDMYDAVDRQLDRVLRALPEDADLIVVAPAGMEANTSRADFLGRMLTAVLEGTVPAERAASVPLWRLRAAVPTPARGVITRALGPTLARSVMARSSVAGVDWSETKAFVVPSDHHGQIRLNLRGRERDGIVDPSEADELCRQIADGLLSFRDEDGSQCVSRVDTAESIVGADAPALRLLPDLLVRWGETPATRLQAVESPTFGRIERTGSGSGRSGGHTDDAFALLVPGRSRLAKRDGDESVVDLTATACSLLGGDLSGLAGTPLLEPAAG